MFLYECIKFSYKITEKLINYCLSKCNVTENVNYIINECVCNCLVSNISKIMYITYNHTSNNTNNTNNTTTFIFTNSLLLSYNFIFMILIFCFIYFICLRKNNENNENNENTNETEYLLNTHVSDTHLPTYNEIDTHKNEYNTNSNYIYNKDEPPNYNEL